MLNLILKKDGKIRILQLKTNSDDYIYKWIWTSILLVLISKTIQIPFRYQKIP